MSIITVGIDLAKNVFAIHGVDEQLKGRIKENQIKGAVVDFSST
ncbi:MAG: hypothetical protein BWY57_01210 [Betaproteobacteria bacterium ADurb.Bin341]|nr:MAG: hypothetical protein BWY57_01210 [Betaproteobacteria bacterium ADurb.Bin341]